MKDTDLQAERAAFESWFKEKSPVVGINAKLAARDAWQSRAAIEADRAQRVPHPVYLSARALIDAARRDWPSSSVHRARVLEAASALESALLASTPAPAQQEPSEAEMVCAEAYQVVGCLLSDLGLFETEAARKILDNLSEARMVHQDVLPWESAAQHQDPPQQERKPMTEESDDDKLVDRAIEDLVMQRYGIRKD